MDTAAPLTIKGVCLDVAGRVLLRRNGRGEWELPGGRPHVGETFPSCLIREIGEETGLAVEVADLIAAYPYEVLPGRWVNVIVYGCEIPDPVPPQTSDEHQRVAFVDLAGVEDQELAAGYRHAVRLWTEARSSQVADPSRTSRPSPTGREYGAAAEGTSGSVRRAEVGGSAAEWVINDLTARANARGAALRPRPRNYERLERPNPASIKVLSERATSGRCAVAVAVEDADGKGYIVIGVFAKDGEELRPKGGFETPDRDVPGRHGPYLGLSAYAGGHFFAGGRLQSAGLGIVGARLIWEDGYELDDTVENGIVMFLGARESIEDPAILEFLDQAGQVIGHQRAFT